MLDTGVVCLQLCNKRGFQVKQLVDHVLSDSHEQIVATCDWKYCVCVPAGFPHCAALRNEKRDERANRCQEQREKGRAPKRKEEDIRSEFLAERKRRRREAAGPPIPPMPRREGQTLQQQSAICDAKVEGPTQRRKKGCKDISEPCSRWAFLYMRQRSNCLG